MMVTDSERVLVVAPRGRDVEVARNIFAEHGIDAAAFATTRELCEAVEREGAGAVVIAEEALGATAIEGLGSMLDRQPPWSDLPVIIITREHDDPSVRAAPKGIVTRFNVTLLERPLAVRTLLAAVQVALRARRRQYEVRSLLERERAASRAKDEFLAMLGHELRNPLSPIVTALHIIRERHPSGIEHELTVLDRQVSHLARLVDDLLDVSRIAQGKIEVKHERLELEAVVSRAVEMSSPLFDQRGHELDVHVDRGLFVLGDATRLAQVFANLLNNAAKYTPPHGRVSLRAAREDGSVVIRVRDNGSGITPEMLPRVFDLFVQERQSLERAGGGLGLGLAIVRSLVLLHGGQVTAASEGPGKGTEITIRLPVLEPQLATTTPSSIAPAPEGQARRVLVVDDNEDAADMLAFALSMGGYETQVAHDGPTALRVADDLDPDVAVLDIGLPVMDGYELARRLRHDPKHERLKLVALTGYGQQEDVRRAMAAGFDEHLVKPVDIERLRSTVDRVLRKQHKRSA